MSEELRNRLRGLGAATPPPNAPRGIDGVRARVGQRRRRRVAGTAMAAVALVGLGGAVAATSIRDRGDGDRNVVVVAGTGENGMPSTSTGDPTTMQGPTTTSTPEMTTGLGRYVVDAVGAAEIFGGPDAESLMVPDQALHTLPSSRARAGTVVVLADDRMTVSVYSTETNTSRTVTFAEIVPDDLWTLVEIDGELMVVDGRNDESGLWVGAWSLTDGSVRNLGRLQGDGASRFSATNDGAVVVETITNDAKCAVERLGAGEAESTVLPVGDCVDRSFVIARDGSNLLAAGPNGVDIVDPETGETVSHFDVGRPVELEGVSLDFDGRFALLGNHYDDAEHGPHVILDTANGTTSPLPLTGTAFFVD